MTFRTKEFFKQVRTYNRLVECKQKRLLELQSVTVYTTAPMGSDGGHGSSDPSRKRTSALINLIAFEDELSNDINMMIAVKQKAMKMIDSLSDPMMIWVLYKRYFDGYSWEKIIAESGYEKTYIYEKHGRALQSICDKYGQFVEIKES